MITLPQLITTDTDMTAGLTSGKAIGSAEDFLALLAGALGTDGAQGKDARITLADLQAAGGKLSKRLLTQHGEPSQATKLADLLAQKANATDETLTDLTQAQHLLSTLTPSLKTSALAALSKTAQHDEKTPALSDEDLASLSALFAMLPGQPVATPVAGETLAENHIALPSLVRSDMRAAPQEETHTLSFSEHEKGKTEASLVRVSDDRATGQSLTPLVVAAATSAKVDVDSPPAPVTHGAAMPTLSSATAQPLPVASAPVLSAPLGSHEWQQTFSQQVMLFTRQGQQSAQLRLHPEELGQVHISLKLDDNQAQLQMVSPHSHVRAALEAALPMLRTQLAESGIQLGQSSISSESFAGQQQSSSQQQQPARAQHADAFGAEDDIALATPASLQAAARGNGAVDIFA
ncbi:TPA: flagellar hook length control protein FliK [Salmonella enterica subsp. salamae serovar 28:r:e,n,z15]|nr:flagellar hook length control protein FliK [Salmonella enterica subsp. salamae serovar 28:r:e,n,z15]